MECPCSLMRSLRYGLVIYAAGVFEKRLCTVDTRITVVAARRLFAPRRSKRIAALRGTAGVHLIHNLFLIRCALTLDRLLRARTSSLRLLHAGRPSSVIPVSNWNRTLTKIHPADGDCWFCDLLPVAPQTPPKFFDWENLSH